MINGFKSSTKTDRYETEMAASDQEVIVVNKTGLIDEISNLLVFGFLTGILIGGSIMHLIICIG